MSDLNLWRFMDLDQEQIRELLDLESRIHETLAAHGWESVRAQAKCEGIQLTKAHALLYAEQAESSEETARYAIEWYRVVDSYFHDHVPLREYLVRSGDISDALERFGVLMPDEVQTVSRAAFVKGMKNPAEHGRAALKALTLAEDTQRIEKLLRAAIVNAEEKLAWRCVQQLQRQLTRADIVEMGCILLTQQGALERCIEYVRRNRVHELYERCFNAIIARSTMSYGEITEFADDVGYTLTDAYLAKLLDSNRLTDEDLFAVATDLEFMGRKGALHNTFRRLRDQALKQGDIRRAETYGIRIDRRLTPDELQNFLTTCRDDTATEEQRRQLEYARDLHAEHINLMITEPETAEMPDQRVA